MGLALVLGAIAGCGGDGRHARAQDAVLRAAAAIDDARTAGGEDASIAAALDRSQRWLSDTEESVERWGSSGAFAYETTAPCLASALADLREALARSGGPVPPSLEEAEAAVLDEGTGSCAERPAPADQRPTDQRTEISGP